MRPRVTNDLPKIRPDLAKLALERVPKTFPNLFHHFGHCHIIKKQGQLANDASSAFCDMHFVMVIVAAVVVVEVLVGVALAVVVVVVSYLP